MKKFRACLWILIFCLLVTLVCIGTGRNAKKDVPLPEQEEKVELFKESLPEQEEEIIPPAEPLAPEQKETVKEEAVTIQPPPVENVYLENVVPEDKDLAPPVEEAQEKEVPPEPFCTLTIRCDAVLENMDKLSDSKKQIIPENGIIFPKEKLPFSEGDSVFDILKKTLTERKIHMDFVNNPMYNSAYVRGISNLYEFDVGDTSGWIYKVNGESPMYGSSQYKIKAGDDIEFVYKCSLY